MSSGIAKGDSMHGIRYRKSANGINIPVLHAIRRAGYELAPNVVVKA